MLQINIMRVYVMNRYEIIFESLQNMVDSGDLTLEEANKMNDAAYAHLATE